MSSSMYRFLSSRVIRLFSSTQKSSHIRGAYNTKFSLPLRLSSSQCLPTAAVKMRIALPSDYDRVMEFMCETYFSTEPSLVNIGLGGDADPPASLVNIMYQQVKEGLTIIGEDADNCLVAAAVNSGSCPWDPERIIQYAECCEKGPVRDIMKFYAFITNAPRLWDQYCVIKVIDCSAISVHPKYQGKGIGRQLVKESWYLARDCGHEVFRIDCMSQYAAKIAEGFGWECVFSMPYKRHIDNGGLVFKFIKEPHTEVQVFADRLLVCKDYCVTNPAGCKIGTAPGGK